jgi:hypothetical protein
MEDMILDSEQEKRDYEFVNSRWIDFGPMTYGRFDICDMEGNMDYVAARKFTEARLREIRNIEEEIEFFEPWIEGVASCIDSAGEKLDRILTREYAALEELKRGMKI